jgi:predicted DNA-binding helix-hairpin-helix protein
VATKLTGRLLGGETGQNPKASLGAELYLVEPVEINRAPRHRLLKIPGIGPCSADRIIEARRETRLRDLSQLKALGVTIGWAAPYVLLDGRHAPQQLSLW